jgi:hypothetical protein
LVHVLNKLIVKHGLRSLDNIHYLAVALYLLIDINYYYAVNETNSMHGRCDVCIYYFISRVRYRNKRLTMNIVMKNIMLKG